MEHKYRKEPISQCWIDFTGVDDKEVYHGSKQALMP